MKIKFWHLVIVTQSKTWKESIEKSVREDREGKNRLADELWEAKTFSDFSIKFQSKYENLFSGKLSYKNQRNKNKNYKFMF